MKLIPLWLIFALSLPSFAQRGPDKAPALGAEIPKVEAKTVDGKDAIPLSEPKRLTVLIFGSHT